MLKKEENKKKIEQEKKRRAEEEERRRRRDIERKIRLEENRKKKREEQRKLEEAKRNAIIKQKIMERRYEEIGGDCYNYGRFAEATFWFFQHKMYVLLERAYPNVDIAHDCCDETWKKFPIFLHNKHKKKIITADTQWSTVKYLWEKDSSLISSINTLDKAKIIKFYEQGMPLHTISSNIGLSLETTEAYIDSWDPPKRREIKIMFQGVENIGFNYYGNLVLEVTEGTLAEKAGVQAGWIIVMINNQFFFDPSHNDVLQQMNIVTQSKLPFCITFSIPFESEISEYDSTQNFCEEGQTQEGTSGLKALPPPQEKKSCPVKLGWTIEQVYSWMESDTILCQYAESFQSNGIDGSKFFSLSQEQLIREHGVTDSQSLEILQKYIKCMEDDNIRNAIKKRQSKSDRPGFDSQKIFIKTTDGNRYEMQVSSTETVKELIKRMEKNLELQNIKSVIHDGKHLEHQNTLRQYNIKENDFLVVIMKKELTTWKGNWKWSQKSNGSWQKIILM